MSGPAAADRRLLVWFPHEGRIHPMKYMMFVATDPEPGSREGAMDIEDWISDVAGEKRLIGDRLRPVSDATTIRVRSDELLVTDGPFTESKEWIVGFDILEC